MIPQAGYPFSRIYLEKKALQYPATGLILDRLRSNSPKIIEIEHYGNVFNRQKQDFAIQKLNPALILAVENKNFIYEGSERINSWGQSAFYYNAVIRNCLYNCEYCFLQGMHSSANILMFVNNEEFIARAEAMASQKNIFLSISYLTDILAFEKLYPYCREWIESCRSQKGLSLEIRTKSDLYHVLADIKPVDRVKLVWTMSPERIANRYEPGAASFKNRLFAAQRSVEDGWKVRLCFDPVLLVDSWQELYGSMITEIFRRIPAQGIEMVSLGVFRINPNYFKKVSRIRPESDLLHNSKIKNEAGDSQKNGVGKPWKLDKKSTYTEQVRRDLRSFMEDELSRYLNREQICFVHG